jgi:hypothetical protein
MWLLSYKCLYKEHTDVFLFTCITNLAAKKGSSRDLGPQEHQLAAQRFSSPGEEAGMLTRQPSQISLAHAQAAQQRDLARAHPNRLV